MLFFVSVPGFQGVLGQILPLQEMPGHTVVSSLGEPMQLAAASRGLLLLVGPHVRSSFLAAS